VPAIPAEPSQVATLIQMTLVPVVMISAVGLVALVVQNRHAVVLERAYRINTRRLELLEELREMDDLSSKRAAWLQGQREIQEALLGRWLDRGTYTRNALVGAFLGVLLFGLTSFYLVVTTLLGASGAWESIGIVLFLAGILAFVACFAFVLVDVYRGLQITRFETSLVDQLMEDLRLGSAEERI
jgi:hypothetical protein